MTDTIEVSHSYTCSNETRTLGEAYGEAKAVNDALTALTIALATMRKTEHPGLRKCATDLDVLIADALHDASWVYWRDQAKEAHVEAMVRTIVRSPAP